MVPDSKETVVCLGEKTYTKRDSRRMMKSPNRNAFTEKINYSHPLLYKVRAKTN